MLAKPFGAGSSLIQGLIVEVILTVSWRERLRGDHRPPPVAAPRRRVALLGESRAGHKGQRCGEADERSGFEHWSCPLNLSGFHSARGSLTDSINTPQPPNIRRPRSGAVLSLLPFASSRPQSRGDFESRRRRPAPRARAHW